MKAEIEYFRRRESQCRAMAGHAATAAIAHIHQQLADFFKQKATDLTHATPPNATDPSKVPDEMTSEWLGMPSAWTQSGGKSGFAAQRIAVQKKQVRAEEKTG